MSYKSNQEVTGEAVQKGKKVIVNLCDEGSAGQISGSCTNLGLVVFGLPV